MVRYLHFDHASYRNNFDEEYLMRRTRNSVDVMLIPDTSGRSDTNDHSLPENIAFGDFQRDIS